MNILVTGGAGYIGSHMVWYLGERGINVVTLDNLSSGYRDAVLSGEFIYGDTSDKLFLDKVFKENEFDAVMHFASSIEVAESIKQPSKYYQNNFVNTLNLLNAMATHGVDKFIFSSTAAIYGNPEYCPIDEGHPKNPINPYGTSKLMVEKMLSDYANAYGIRSVCLRYFNAAGAHPQSLLGERHNPETHLIPLILKAAKSAKPRFTVFGNDYDTPDGTCIRDYIHVMDIVEAHWLSVNYLINGGDSQSYNLGTGTGYSVAELIKVVEQIVGQTIEVIEGPRRAGDPAILIADASKIKNSLGWQPTRSDTEQLVTDAWAWEVKN